MLSSEMMDGNWRGKSANLNVLWRVPVGPFEGGLVDEIDELTLCVSFGPRQNSHCDDLCGLSRTDLSSYVNLFMGKPKERSRYNSYTAFGCCKGRRVITALNDLRNR